MRRGIDSAARRGAVLILMLWMLILLGVIGLSYSASVRTQLSVQRLGRGRTEAYWAARAGIEKAMAEIAALDTAPLAVNEPLFDSEEEFKDQKVGPARFSLIVPRLHKGDKQRYGLVDESARLNINVAEQERLLKLPLMTDEMAQSLLDWRSRWRG